MSCCSPLFARIVSQSQAGQLQLKLTSISSYKLQKAFLLLLRRTGPLGLLFCMTSETSGAFYSNVYLVGFSHSFVVPTTGLLLLIFCWHAHLHHALCLDLLRKITSSTPCLSDPLPVPLSLESPQPTLIYLLSCSRVLAGYVCALPARVELLLDSEKTSENRWEACKLPECAFAEGHDISGQLESVYTVSSASRQTAFPVLQQHLIYLKHLAVSSLIRRREHFTRCV